jgi:hypothetical protein
MNCPDSLSASEGSVRAATMLRSLENHPTGAIMAEETKDDRVTLEQLMVSTLAMTDAAIELLIQKGFTNGPFNGILIPRQAAC